MPRANGSASRDCDEATPLLFSNHGAPPPAHRSPPRLSDRLLPSESWPALLQQCVLTGLFDAITFASMRTWVGFMTGNLTQIALALIDEIGDGPLEIGGTSRLTKSVVALAGYCAGAYGIAALLRLLKRRRARSEGRNDDSSCYDSAPSRGWYLFISLSHIVFFSLHFLLIRLYPSSPSTNLALVSLALLALPMGSQTVLSLTLGSPNPYSTTVVFTSSLANMCADPSFPRGLIPGSDRSKSTLRHRAMSIFALVFGSLLGGAIILAEERWTAARAPARGEGNGRNSSDDDAAQGILPTTWACVVVILLQTAIAASWWTVPAKPVEEARREEDDDEEEGA
ncbi:hypothetical protein BDZ90DRAFT_234132 [Jaminaea rosea]|uniref:DUF1275-domain-containing protein n=1 Tax=Jaminaea rosea TaxID=1569628 RepID=A0A316UQ73_9BASI|nr:hypothetical protein BDZ90DRAFT_234132 [Jaminaea rosea]PWN25285.1 hypothetical protein BDZ90DRAFT_234132 [Jaminaea rosea]